MLKVSKIQISGRLNGAEMARSESYKDGRIPLSALEQILITL
jgi:ribosomal protein S3